MSTEEVRIVVIGDGTVGKTCVLCKYRSGDFSQKYIPTIVENYTKQADYKGKKIQLSLWDTAGQEEYEKIRSLSYPGTHCFLIMFDVTQPSSFENAISKWYYDIKCYNT